MQKQLRSYFESNLPKYLDFLQQMVSINSFTANAAGVNAVGDLTVEKFTGLGFDADRAQSVNPDFGKHVILTRKGRSDRKLGLVSHLDTVFPPEEEAANDFSWRVEGNRIYGPGTNDIKGGTVMITMILEAIQRFAPQVFDDLTWVILLNAAEERLSEDFGALCRQRLGENTLAALIFEAGKFDGARFCMVTARKGMAIYEVSVKGKSAHAGNYHHTGANAIVQLAQIIQQIAGLTNYDRNLTFNVGVVSGGTVPNRVPHQAEARGEMRTFSTETYNQGIASLLALGDQSPLSSADGDFSCQVDIQIIQKNAPWPCNPDTERLLSLWQETALALGTTVEREKRGGLSDGNHIWQQVPTLDGLGPDGGNAHCSERTSDGSKDQEYVTISSFVPKATLDTLAILTLTTAN